MTTPTPLFAPPPIYDLPLSKGGDLSVDFRNNPNSDGTTFVDYEAGVTVTLTIDTDPVIEADASIDGYHAYVKVESAVVDLVKARVAWRAVVSTPTSPPTETVAANGKTQRFDGA